MEDDEHVTLDPNFIPEGWLFDYPSSPTNSKHLSLSKKDQTLL